MQPRHSLPALTFASLGGLLLLAAGCDLGGGCVTGSATELVCEPSGTGTLQAPPQLGLRTTFDVVLANCSEDMLGAGCQHGGSFSFSTGSRSNYLFGSVTLPAAAPAGAYTLTFPTSDSYITAGSVYFSLNPDLGDPRELRVVSGTVTVENRSRHGFSAEYSFVLEDPASGERISLSGHATVGDCHDKEVCTF